MTFSRKWNANDIMILNVIPWTSSSALVKKLYQDANESQFITIIKPTTERFSIWVDMLTKKIQWQWPHSVQYLNKKHKKEKHQPPNELQLFKCLNLEKHYAITCTKGISVHRLQHYIVFPYAGLRLALELWSTCVCSVSAELLCGVGLAYAAMCGLTGCKVHDG